MKKEILLGIIGSSFFVVLFWMILLMFVMIGHPERSINAWTIIGMLFMVLIVYASLTWLDSSLKRKGRRSDIIMVFSFVFGFLICTALILQTIN